MSLETVLTTLVVLLYDILVTHYNESRNFINDPRSVVERLIVTHYNESRNFINDPRSVVERLIVTHFNELETLLTTLALNKSLVCTTRIVVTLSGYIQCNTSHCYLIM